MDLFDKEKYVAAQEEFGKIVDSYEAGWREEVYTNARYYYALCALRLYQDDAEFLLLNFLKELPESPKVKQVYFQLGLFKFRKRRYKDVIAYLTKIDIYELSNEELAEYYFKLGYSYFMRDDHKKAAELLYEIKDTDTRYTAAARYYYAHISYEQGKYQNAYLDFKKIEDDKKFGPVVPYYLCQILYYQEKYEELIRYAPGVLDSANPKRAFEISRLLGQAYYKTEDFDKATSYLEKSHHGSRYISPSDAYQMAYAYYMSKQYDNAVIWFKQAAVEKDSLGQLALFQLGRALLESGDKKGAREALRQASEMKYYPDIKKQALFNYAKLSYELSYHPFDDAILAFEEFINTYPNAEELEDAYDYLVGIYFTTKNYKSALESLDRIKKKDKRLEEAYQKVTHYRGLELYAKGQYKAAVTHFSKSRQHDHLKDISAKNQYWTGLAYYHMDKYKESILELEAFVKEARIPLSDEFKYASYSIGYAYYKQQDLDNALTWFRRFNNEKNVDEKMQVDALLRTADAFNLKRDYRTAVEFYDKAALKGVFDVDYAYYQSAVANGRSGKEKDKISLLNTLISDYERGKYPRKSYLDDALYELGNTYFNTNNTDKALEYYNKLTTTYKESSLRYAALLQIGLIHYNKGNDDAALEAYKEVYGKSPIAEEKNAALNQIEKILKDAGRIEELEAFKKGAGVKYEDSELERDLFESAENKYLEGKCDEAIAGFSKYLNRFPTGLHALEAHYHRAECKFLGGDKKGALEDYDYVTKVSNNEYTERSFLQAGALAMELKKHSKALNYYRRLEAANLSSESTRRSQNEILALAQILKDTAQTIRYSYVVLKHKNLTRQDQERVWIVLGRTYYAQSNDSAEMVLKQVKWVKNEIGAESSYLLARIDFNKGEVKKAEDGAYRVLDKFSGYHDWVARSFILLADVYINKEDYYSARAALNNVLDNYEGDANILNEAQQKMDLIDELERKKKDQGAGGPDEIDLGDGGKKKGGGK